MDVTGRLRKMPAVAADPVAYTIAVGDTRIPLNELILRPVYVQIFVNTLTFTVRSLLNFLRFTKEIAF